MYPVTTPTCIRTT